MTLISPTLKDKKKTKSILKEHRRKDRHIRKVNKGKYL